jgi:hypothetical protein
MLATAIEESKIPAESLEEGAVNGAPIKKV